MEDRTLSSRSSIERAFSTRHAAMISEEMYNEHIRASRRSSPNGSHATSFFVESARPSINDLTLLGDENRGNKVGQKLKRLVRKFVPVFYIRKDRAEFQRAQRRYPTVPGKQHRNAELAQTIGEYEPSRM